MSRGFLKRSFLSVFCLGAAAVAAAVAQEGQQPQLPQPTEQHIQMAREAGEWEADITFWQSPGAEPMKSKGTETNKMFGKFWLLSEFKSDFFGMEYTGRGQFGYDPLAKKCVGTWIDTMSPHMQTMEGNYDEETHTLTMNTKGMDPATGEVMKGRNVTTFIDNDTKKFQMYAPGPDGKEFKVMEVMYKRKK